jgi:hypothetical protein
LVIGHLVNERLLLGVEIDGMLERWLVIPEMR